MQSFFAVLMSWRMAVVLLLGFSCGLPLGLSGATLTAWMADMKVDLSIIGLTALVGTPYTLKFLWSPMMDRFSPRVLSGRRRAWILVTQLLLVAAIAAMGLFWTPPVDIQLTLPSYLQSISDWEKTAHFLTQSFIIFPIKFLFSIPLLAQFLLLPLLVAFFSASQDIVVDAYRTELMDEKERGASAGLYVTGYRLAMLVSGALALILADHLPWGTVYLIMAACMSLGILATIFAPKPKVDVPAPASLKQAVVSPLKDYFARRGAWEILVFIMLFKLGDVMCGQMTTPMMLELGFTKTDIGAVNKGFGMIATIIGGVFGGTMMARLGTVRSLWIFGGLQAISNLVFAILAMLGHNYPAMVAAIAIENLAGGMGTAAFVAFFMSLCNVRFTATQYALLSSLMAVPRSLLGSTSGILAKSMGWQSYFVFTTIVAIPGLLMLLRNKAWSQSNNPDEQPSPTPGAMAQALS